MAQPKIAGTIRSKNPLKGAVEILPERLYYASLKAPPPSHNILASTPKRGVKVSEKATAAASGAAAAAAAPKKQIHFFNIDNELVYWNFFLDFGPLNLGQLTRFCEKLNDKLAKFPVVCFYSSCIPAKRANAIWLICAYQLLYLDRSPEDAWAGFEGFIPKGRERMDDAAVDGSRMSLSPVSQSQGAVTIAPLPPWHDASPCACTYDLTVFDCLKGFQKARMHGFYDPESFDVEEYEHFEQVENGDLNWIVKGKILAFAGPSFERNVSPEGYCTLAPSDYIPYFQRKNVGLVVRLNKRCYNEQDFVNAGIKHVDAFFLDGSCPPTKVLYKVLEAFENCETAFAVHCKAGLGRTGTCIGAYLMKHYRFTAAEAIAWMRICRPGCVIGPQQHYLKQIEARMWAEGEAEGRHVERPLPAAGTEEEDEDEEVVMMDANDREAATGRAGQAEALLSARGRRGHHQQESTPLDVPMTPEQSTKNKLVAVTPDTASRKSQATQLWCS